MVGSDPSWRRVEGSFTWKDDSGSDKLRREDVGNTPRRMEQVCLRLPMNVLVVVKKEKGRRNDMI
jgi:hypothetical protein